MIRSLFIILFLFIALQANAQVIFKDSLKNLGDTRAGDTRKVEYRIQNKYKVPMVLELFPSCVCQQLDTSIYTIPPQSESIIHFYLNTFGMKNEVNSSLKVSMHDTSNHIIGDRYIYYTVNLVKWQPKELAGNGICTKFAQSEKNSGDIHTGVSQNYSFDFQNCGSDTLYITDVGIPETWVTAYTRAGIAPIKKGVINISTAKQSRTGNFTYLIPVTFTSRGKIFRTDLTVKGNVIE